MKWISVKDKKPPVKKGCDSSENVLAIVEGYTQVQVMAYCFVDDGESSGWVWANCYGDINGDAEWDENYNVTHWMPLPKPPESIEGEDAQSEQEVLWDEALDLYDQTNSRADIKQSFTITRKP